MENYALDTLKSRKEKITESEDLEGVARLYYTIVLSRILRSDIVQAMSMANETRNICLSLNAVRLQLQLLPNMIVITLLRQQINECVEVLKELGELSSRDFDKSARTWYFAFCMIFQLETGLTHETYKKCEQFFQEEGESMITLRDPDSKKRYFVSMWLWCVRNEQWDSASIWESHIHIPSLMLDKENVTNIICLLYLLEGKLIKIVSRLDMRDVQQVNKSFQELDRITRHILKASQSVRMALPRFNILYSLYRHIRLHDVDAIRYLLKGKYIAQKHGNLLDLQWSEHTEKVWTGTIATFFKDFWREHCQPDNLLYWNEGVTGSLVMFSFPIPMLSV
ncbi:hypothetical protein L9F63_009644 [Diploptera punctata]|uniref:Uncharacterized protein n=1 Tax=Diploptera punctata TaxID=6984 RepID=A0AAD8AIZ7_DIPPU|nr:hypothetical protein L9F63_009644 [Diploptera punctata]